MMRTIRVAGLPPAVVAAMVAAACLLATTSARAADLTLLCAGAMKGPVSQILAGRSAAEPHVDATYATAGVIRERIEKGDVFDVVVAPSDVISGLATAMKVDLATRRALGTTEIGVAVAAGAPLPDIGSVDALRAALLQARKVVIVDPDAGTSGRLAIALFETLRIADAMDRKLLKLPGGNVLEAVARGDADLGLQQVSEILPVPGVRLVGGLPGELKRSTRYDVAAMRGSTSAAEARRLVETLESPASRAVIAKSGFAPAS